MANDFVRHLKKDRSSTKIPLLRMHPSFLNTAEGCYLWNTDRETSDQESKSFYLMPGKLQQQMEYLPEGGEYAERLKVWGSCMDREMTLGKFGIAMREITVLFKKLA